MDFQNQKPIYLQIADYIAERILLNEWKIQEKIPSVREMAVNLSVNPNTVMRSYAYLEEQQIIATQRGIGYFVMDDAKERVIELKKTEFLTRELPQIFRSMDLLSIPFEHVQHLYHERTKK